jgi:hypothetical protein
MLRPRHTLTRVILITAAWALMSGAFATTAAADTGGSANIQVIDKIDTSGHAADAGSATASCMWQGTPVDCVGPSGSRWLEYCYGYVFSDDPSDSTPLVKKEWDRLGKTSGVLLQCRYRADGSSPAWDSPYHDPYWVETDTPPSLVDLTNEVYLIVDGIITAPQIGIFPGDLLENNPEAMGLVGVPTWFWSKNPGPGIGSPWTKTTEVLGHTLRVDAELDRTVWDTGDGGQVVCGLGTKAYNVHKPKLSPSRCDHVYMERGTYTVTATSHVSVTWSGAGRSGSFSVSVQRSGSYHVGENQVLIVSGPTAPD